MKLDVWGAEETWLIDYMNRRAVFKVQNSEKDMKAYLASRNNPDKPSMLKIEGNTASINIRGVLSQGGPDFLDYFFGYFGSSYREIISAVRELKENSTVETLYLNMDTPGGNITGLDNVWKELMSLRKETKIKIIAVNYGMLASAGYYIASAAHEIHSTSETNYTGSIGVVVAGTDWSKYDEKNGIKDVVIVSKNAPDKYIDIGTEKGQALLQERVDVAEQFFFKRISAGRKLEEGYIKKNFGRGGVLISQSPEAGGSDALSVKMIDKVLGVNQEGAASSTSPVSANSQNGKRENKIMSQTLMEFLQANMGAKVEFDTQLKAAENTKYEEGLKDGQEIVNARVKKAFDVVGKSDAYPSRFVKMAMQVASGDEEQASLTAVITMFDQGQEERNSNQAQAETNATGETSPSSQNDQILLDGKGAKTSEELSAFTAGARALKGLSPKSQTTTT